MTGRGRRGRARTPARVCGARAGVRRTAVSGPSRRPGLATSSRRNARPTAPRTSGSAVLVRTASRTSRWVASLITISPVPSALREPGGPSERLPAHEPLGRRRVALENFAGVDPDANVDRDCSLLLELLVQAGHCLPQLERRPHGTKGIVLVQSRDAEDRARGCRRAVVPGLRRGARTPARQSRSSARRSAGEPRGRGSSSVGPLRPASARTSVTVLRARLPLGAVPAACSVSGGTLRRGSECSWSGSCARAAASGSSSSASWRRIAASRSRNAAPGSMPSSSDQTRRVSRYSSSASTWRPDRYRASIS